MTAAELHLADELRRARRATTAESQLDEACRQNDELRAALAAEQGERAEAEAKAERLKAALGRIAGAEPHSIPADAHGHGVADCPGCIRFIHWALGAVG